MDNVYGKPKAAAPVTAGTVPAKPASDPMAGILGALKMVPGGLGSNLKLVSFEEGKDGWNHILIAATPQVTEMLKALIPPQ